MKSLLPLLLGAALLGSSGCTYRYIYGVQDTPIATATGNPSTVLEVVETKWWVFFPVQKDVYYECTRNGTDLDCIRLCDIRNEEGDKVRCRFINLSN